MGIDVVAVLHCEDAKLLARLQREPQLGADIGRQLDALMAAVQRGDEELPIPLALTVLRVGRDFALVYTGVRFRDVEADAMLGRVIATRILESVPGVAHVEPRGMLLYPDVAEPRGTRYEEVVAELEPHFWANVTPLDPAERRAWHRARIAALGAG